MDPLSPPRRHADPNIVALLSLKLLLLGFFILLNALSQFEEDRSRSVIESINEAFNGRVEARESLSNSSAGLGQLPDAVAVLQESRELFESLLPAVRSDSSAGGRRVRLELPAGTLFRRDQARLQPGRGLLLRRLAEALRRRTAKGEVFELTLLHGVPAAASGEADSQAALLALAIQRMDLMVRYLTRRGLAGERLSIGLLPGQPDRMQLVVQAHDSPPRELDFSDLAP